MSEKVKKSTVEEIISKLENKEFDGSTMIGFQRADLGTSFKNPSINIDSESVRKSRWPLHFDAITGKSQQLASNIGRPNPSPWVQVMKAPIFGWL